MTDSVKIDISRLCDASKPAIVEALGAEEQEGRIFASGTPAQVKQAIEKMLPEGYVVAESTEDPMLLAVLKEGDIEQLGLYLCGYCATVFRNEVERNLHQRVHYFGFG
ncbi:hypothetical protein [Nitrososphaera sp.]|uniref:hypothetical protein n=1 Tax=Nitrososphaera sp. TaxID=1971748 RepID=UPI0025F63663|nr:hypothetical protein [Nitrososphaera sp.]